jgi:branched-chain amino acid transport system permease protein
MIFLFSFPFLGPPGYFLALFFSVFMFVALTESWNVMGGYAGYVSFGHVAFFSIGAYCTALFMNHVGISPFYTAILGGGVAGTVAALVGFFVLRLRGAYFVIATLLLSVVMRLIFLNWGFVGSSSGLWFKLLPVSMETNRLIFYEIMLTLAIVITLVVRKVERSKFGMGLIAIREDEEVAQSLGINAPRLKLLAFTLSGSLAGVVGGIYGYYMSYIHPDLTFNINITLLILLMASFGGPRTWTGPLLGAITLSLVNQYIETFIGAEVSRILYGLLLITVVIFMPNGIIEHVGVRRMIGKYIAE